MVRAEFIGERVQISSGLTGLFLLLVAASFGHAQPGGPFPPIPPMPSASGPLPKILDQYPDGPSVSPAASRPDNGAKSHQEIQPSGAVAYRKDGAAGGCGFDKIGLDRLFSSEHTVVLWCIVHELPLYQHLSDMVGAESIGKIGQ